MAERFGNAPRSPRRVKPTVEPVLYPGLVDYPRRARPRLAVPLRRVPWGVTLVVLGSVILLVIAYHLINDVLEMINQFVN